MKYLEQLLLKKTIDDEIIRPDELESIAYILINELNIKSFVKNIIITDFSRLFIDNKRKYINAHSFYDGKNIYFDYMRIYNYVNNKFSKSIFINMYLINVLFHELNHAIQNKKVNTDFSNVESLILYISYLREKTLRRMQIYKKFYKYNPIERQAEIKALKTTINLSRKLMDSNNILDKQLKKIETFGYDENNSLKINPSSMFFCTGLQFIDNSSISYDTRIEFGLPIKKLKI